MSIVETSVLSLVSSIQVSGNKAYDGNQWREAILAYLDGIWSGRRSVTNRPKLNFNNTTIRLGDGGRYYAYFASEPDKAPFPPTPKNDSELLTIMHPTEYAVEVGLIRFVRNNQIRQLALMFDNGVSSEGIILLAKGQRRGELHIYTYGLVSITIWMQRLGYNV